MKYIIFIFLFFLQNEIYCKIIVKVGSSQDQPPYVLEDNTGLSQDILDALNKIQNKYEFTLVSLPTLRLRQKFTDGTIHMISLSNINWGYEKISKKSIDLLKVEDKYFTLKDLGITQDYFKNIGKESTVVVNGFNYKFLNNQKDQKILEEKYNTKTVLDENAVYLMILNRRAKIGVISSTFLNHIKLTQKLNYSKLLIADVSDSEYYRHCLLNKYSPISINELNTYLVKLKNSGELAKIFKDYVQWNKKK